MKAVARLSVLGLLGVGAAVWAAPGTVNYQYDEAGRLKQTTYTGGTNRAYTLDAAGNRTATTATLGGGEFQFTAATASVAEGTASIALTVSRSSSSSGAVSVTCSTTNGTADASDFTATSVVLNWANGDSANKTCTVPILNDSTYEVSETFTANLTNPVGGILGAQTSTTVTITDNDSAPTLSIANVSVSESAGSVTVTVTKSGSSALTHAVNYATANGTAIAGTNYTAASGTLTFAPADTTKTFSVPIIDNSVYDVTKAFSASISGPTNGATLGTGSATVTINENESPPSFSINNASDNEWHNYYPVEPSRPGQLVFTVTKTGSTALSHTVNWATADGTAVAPGDYVAGSGVLTFAPNETTQIVYVDLSDDYVYEGNETLSVNLSAPSNGATLGTATGTGTIIDDEPQPPPGTLSFTASSASPGESAGSVTMQVSRTGGSNGTVSATCSTSNNTATAPADYTSTSTVLTWTNGDTANKSCTVPIANDSALEATETFYMSLSGPTGGATLGTSTATISVIDDDPVTFSISNVTVAEGGGSVTLTVTKSGTTSLTHDVNYGTANGSAVAGSDYTGTSGTLSFAPSDTSKTFTVPITQDSVYEGGNETFSASLSSPTNNATIATGTATVTITDDDPAVSFSVNSVSSSEFGYSIPPEYVPSYLTFTVSLSSASGVTHQVNYATANGSATAGADYVATSGTLTFTPGQTSQPVYVYIENDATYEGNETLTLNLSSATNGAGISSGTGTGTIVDDEPQPPPGTLSFTASSANPGESAGSVTMQVSRTGGSYGTVSVTCSTSNNTATAPSDYTSTSTVLTWTNGDTANKSCTVPIANDSILEATETFYMSLSGPTGGASLGTSTATISVIDDDPVTFSISNVTVAEGGGSVTLTVTKSGTTSLSHNVNYGTANGSAVAGSDYTATSGTLTFATSDTSKTFTVPITQDSSYEGNETFSASLSSPTNNATIATGTATVTITDDDPAVTFSVNSVSASELGYYVPPGDYAPSYLTFTVSLSSTSGVTHQVNYATADGSATANVDYVPTSGTLTFTPGQTSQTVYVYINDDSTYEGNETLTLNLSSATNGAGISSGTGTGTIVDDEPPPPPGTLNFTASAVVVNEAAGSVSVGVSRTGGSGGAVSVTCSTSDSNATAPSDYTATTVTLTWANGDTATKYCTIPIVDDSTPMEGQWLWWGEFLPYEPFAVSLSGATGGASIGSTGTMYVNIEDND